MSELEFSQLLESAAATAASAGLRWTADRKPPTSDQRLIRLEESLAQAISPSHANFLRLSDGLLMGLYFDPPGSYDNPLYFGVSIHGCNEIEQETIENRRVFGVSSGLIAVARYGMCGDQCFGVAGQGEGGEYPIADGFSETPDAWGAEVLAARFDDWLRQMFFSLIDKHHLLAYWLNESIEEMRRDILA